LAKQLSQLKPRTLIGGKKCNSSLLSVIAHEDRDEERQDENGTKQVEYDEEDTVPPTTEGFRLGIHASNGHTLE
jgi:hypothetical protein